MDALKQFGVNLLKPYQQLPVVASDKDAELTALRSRVKELEARVNELEGLGKR